MIAAGDYIEMLMPSHFGQSTELLEKFARELDVDSRDKARQRDPLELVLNLNALLYSKIAYVPKSTQVDSPIDHALESRQGVCQDFAHIMIGLTRRIGIPCRYVSGYLFHKEGERSQRRRHSRLGGDAASGVRLGGIRSYQQCNRGRPARAHLRWPRLCRRSSDERRVQRIGREPVAGGRPCCAVRCAASSIPSWAQKTGPRRYAKKPSSRSRPLTICNNSNSSNKRLRCLQDQTLPGRQR